MCYFRGSTTSSNSHLLPQLTVFVLRLAWFNLLHADMVIYTGRYCPVFFFYAGFCWLLCSWTHLESAAASSLSSFQIVSGATCDLWVSIGHNCQHLPWSLCQGESAQFCASLGFWPCSSALTAYKVSKIVADSQVPEKQLDGSLIVQLMN